MIILIVILLFIIACAVAPDVMLCIGAFVGTLVMSAITLGSMFAVIALVIAVFN